MSENPNRRVLDIINEARENIGAPMPKEEVQFQKDSSIKRERISETNEDELRKEQARKNLARRQAEREIKADDLVKRVKANQAIGRHVNGLVMYNGFTKVAENFKSALAGAKGKIAATALALAVVSGTIHGVTGFSFNETKAAEFPDNPKTEQVTTSTQDLTLASKLSEKDKLTNDEVETLKQANVGDNPVVGHWEDATLLKDDPNYVEPDLDKLRSEVKNEEASDIAMEKFQNGEPMTTEETQMLQNQNKTGNTLEPDWFSIENVNADSINESGMSR